MLKRFFLIVCGSFVGTFLALVVFMLSAILLSVAMLNMGKGGHKVADKSVLHLCLEGPMEERVGAEELDVMSLIQGGITPYMSLEETLQALEVAKTDDRIEGVLIECKGVSAAPATLRQVRQAVIDFKKSGKFVYAYGNEGYDQSDYYVATAADSIFINPIGAVSVHGIASVTPYFKKVLDKVGVEMQVVRVGTYKSAVEPFMIDSISPANREQQELYLGNIWGTMSSEMAASRKLSVSALNLLADSITFTMPTAKLKASHLIDGICYRHELDSRLKRLCDLDEDDDLRLVSITDLAANYEYKKGKDGDIAVVYAVGEIDGGSGGINSEEIVATVEDLMKDDDVKGMVLRVNSPGGSAFGSEQIWEVLERFKKTGRPLAVSMGDYAASGGYYISCGADHIFADSVTITGSIGVFGMIPCMEELVHDKIGVNVSVVKTNANAEMGASTGLLSKKFTPVQLAAMQNYVNQTYDLFTKRCADGRHMPQDSIKMIAEGRVWDAKSAMERKLIDAYGSLNDAIAWVAQKAGLAQDRYGVLTAPAIEMNWRTMLSSFASMKVQQKLQEEMGLFYEYYDQLQAILNRRHVLCLMPYSEIK